METIALYFLVLGGSYNYGGKVIVPEKYTWEECLRAGEIATNPKYNPGRAVGNFSCVPAPKEKS